MTQDVHAVKTPRIPLRRLRREMGHEHARLVVRIEKHIQGIWPSDVSTESSSWVLLSKLWHGPPGVQFSLGKLVAFTETRLPLFQVTHDRFWEVSWRVLSLEELWEVLPTIRKMRGLAKGQRVNDPFEKRDEPSPRYYYWARRAAAGFVPNKRYWMEGYDGRSMKLGVTNREREVLDAMFKKNKERL
jgi:hypothetical protein